MNWGYNGNGNDIKYLANSKSFEDVESESDGFINSPRWNGYYRIKYCIYNITEMP